MKTPNFTELSAIYVNCTLKKSPSVSNTQGLLDLSANIMEKEGVKVNKIRFVDFDVPPGMSPDMTEQGWETDEFPELFEKQIFPADILIIGSPIWLGEISSVTKKFIERIYGMSEELNEKGQYQFYGKAGGCIITGNEDGIKHCASGILYSLQHIGYSIPPQADSGWVGDAGPGPSYLDDESNAQSNDFTNQTTTFMTYNLLHLAKMLKINGGYPAYGNSQKEWSEGKRWKFEKL